MAEPVTKTEQEQWAIDLTDKCETHGQWLSIVRFGLGELLKNQPLLMECIVRESTREADRFNTDRATGTHAAADHARIILDELRLQFAILPMQIPF